MLLKILLPPPWEISHTFMVESHMTNFSDLLFRAKERQEFEQCLLFVIRSKRILELKCVLVLDIHLERCLGNEKSNDL